MARMKNTSIDLSRRTFLQRSALLVSALGVGASVQSGLMDAIVRKAKHDFGSATAQANPATVDFHIEINSRLGLQTNALFPSPSHMLPIGTGPGQRFGKEALNFYWSSNSIQKVDLPTGRSLYLAGVDGLGNMGPNPLAAFADRIAISEAVHDQDGFFPHIQSWKTRFPNAMAPPPSVMHNYFAPNDVPVGGARIGINEGFIGVSHEARGLPPMEASIPDDIGFVNLYRDMPLPFSYDELRLIVGTFDQQSGSLQTEGLTQKLDSVWRSTVNMKGVNTDGERSLLVNGGRGLSTLQIDLRLDNNPTPNVPFNDISTDPGLVRGMFGYDDLNMMQGQVHWGRTLLHAWQAMSLGLIRTVAIDFDSQDWHTDRPNGDAETLVSKQGLWATVLTRSLANFLAFAEATPNPIPGRTGSIADSLLISMSSEFSRSPFNNNDSDNGDGYTQGYIFIGSKVKGGTLGDIDTYTRPLELDENGFTAYGENRVVSFDPNTGALAPGAARQSPGDVWATHMELLGMTESDFSMYNVDGRPITAVIEP